MRFLCGAVTMFAAVRQPPLGLDLYTPVPESNPLTPASSEVWALEKSSPTGDTRGK
jgi:hypothetical protein